MMPNPFDQFDSQGGNQFDQFDAPAENPPVSAAPPPAGTQGNDFVVPGDDPPGPPPPRKEDVLSQVPLAERALRVGESAARGFVNSALNTIGALPDAAAEVINSLRVPEGQETFYSNPVSGMPVPTGRYYTSALKKAVGGILHDVPHPVVSGPPEPTGTIERGAYGAGQGVADAASVILPAAAVSRAARAGTVTSGIANTLRSQPAMQAAAGMTGGAVGEATGDPYLGTVAALATPALTGAARRIVSPRGFRGMTREARRLAQVLERENVPVRVSQLSGSKAVKLADDAAGHMFPASMMREADVAAQKIAYNRAVLRHAGINADAATPDVMEAASQRFSQAFRALIGNTNIPVTNSLRRTVNNAIKGLYRRIPPDHLNVAQAYVDDITNASYLNGETYQATRSRLSKMAKDAAAKSDTILADFYGTVANALDDHVGGTLPSDMLRRMWAAQRRLYANFKNIQQAISTTTVDAMEGNISPSRLLTAISQQRGRGGYTRGVGDLNDLARAGRRFLPEAIGSSGTAERGYMTAALSAAPSVAALAMTDPATAAKIIAGQVAVPAAVYRGMNNRIMRRYLTNQLIAQQPQLTGGVTAAITGARAKDLLTGPGN